MTAPTPHTDAPTAEELRIAESYLGVLDYVSRCAKAVREGDFGYLSGKAGDLADRAADLEKATANPTGSPAPRGWMVNQLVSERSQNSETAAVLHPRGKNTATTNISPFLAPAGGDQ